MDVIVRETVSRGIQQYTQEQHNRAVSAIRGGCIRIKTAAQGHLKWRNAPGWGLGGRATGHLAESIAYNVKQSYGREIIEGIVGVGVTYGKYVEGRPVPTKHWVSFETAPGLRDWLQRHGILIQPGSKPAYLGKGYMVGGPGSVTPFLEPAATAELPRILQNLITALAVR